MTASMSSTKAPSRARLARVCLVTGTWPTPRTRSRKPSPGPRCDGRTTCSSSQWARWPGSWGCRRGRRKAGSGEAGGHWLPSWVPWLRRSRPPTDELGSQLAELTEEAASRARAAGPAAARRCGTRRRGRQATGLVLIASLVARLVWVGQRPMPSADASKGWKTYSDASGNLRFRYPPGWAVEPIPRVPGSVSVVPPEDAGRPAAPTSGGRSGPGNTATAATTRSGSSTKAGCATARDRPAIRLTLRLVDHAGWRLPVAGNPATTTGEGDLPEDQLARRDGSWVIDGALMWRFAWEQWCNKDLPPATLRVTANGGATLTTTPGSGCDQPARQFEPPGISGGSAEPGAVHAGTETTALEPAGTADLFDLAEDRFDALLAQGIAGLALWAGQPSPPTPQPRPSHLAGRLHTGSG